VLQILSLKKSKSRGRAASNARRSDGEKADDRKSSSGRSLFIGSVIDNIPENAVLGITRGRELCTTTRSLAQIDPEI
jgi:hypothetical protein